MRTFEFAGTRRGVRLDAGTWTAVDWLAQQRGVKWSELAREWATLGTHGDGSDGNLTRIIRSAAMAELLNETILAERADGFGGLQATGFRLAGMFGDDDFAETKSAGVIEDTADLVSVKVHAGINEHGCIAFYVENQLAECPHLVISTPFTATEWLDRVGA